MPISTLKKINITDKVKKYKLIIEDEVESKMELQDGRIRQFAMLKTLIDNPSMMFCGPTHPYKINMYHSGQRWIIEMEAIVEEREDITKVVT